MNKTDSYTLINIDELRQTRSECNAHELYQRVKAGSDFLAFTRIYAFNSDEMVARNALWVLTKARKKELAVLHELLPSLIDQAMRTINLSVRRLTLYIIERQKMEVDDLRTDFLDFCLDQMMRIEEPPAIQAVCMKLAYRMCRFYPELLAELKRTLETMEIDYYKPAVKCVRNRILSGKLK